MSDILDERIRKTLRKLHLKDMAEYLDEALDKAQKQQNGYLGFLADLVEHQLHQRQKRSFDNRVKKALFPRNMTFDNYDWNFQPSLDVQYLKDLMELAFVVDHKPLLILGKTGSGKTHIATSLGILACRANFRVAFYSLQNLMTILYASLADDTTDELITQLSRLDLLIIDNVGNLRPKPEYPSLLLDLVSSCQAGTSFIVTSGISLENWGNVLENPTITMAIVDRLLHRAEIINFRKGLSYRTQGPHASSVEPDDNDDNGA